MDLFEFLEGLFDGASEFPEKVEVRVVRGKDFATMGPSVKQYPYPAGSTKPTREKLVGMSNEILNGCQRMTDVHRKRTVFHVAAIHFSRDPAPYTRFLLDCMPGATYKNGENGEIESDDDGEATPQNQMLAQVLLHGREMFSMFGGAFEGLLDRMDRMQERVMKQNDSLDARNQNLANMLENALDRREEREERKMWLGVKTRLAEKGADLAIAMAPAMLNQFVGGGKQVVPAETPEALVLKEFFKTTDEGGKLTKEQADAAFGIWDSGRQNTAGVLKEEQVAILYGVAHGQKPVVELDMLMPGGSCAITVEQVMSLNSIFSMEQIAPIMMTFQARSNKRQ